MSVYNFPQFTDEYDGYKMRAMVEEVIRQFQGIQQESPQTGGGGGNGVSDHNLLTGRSDPDQHPIAAITGLQAALDLKANQADFLALQSVVNAHIVNVSNPHQVTLQQAYDQSTTPPQISLNGTPDPFTIDATVAGDIFALRDTTDADLVRFATTGSLIHGGVNSGDELAFRGSSDAGRGELDFRSPSFYSFDFTTVSPANQQIITYDAVVPASGGAVASFILVDPEITIDNGLFIPSTIRDIGEYIQTVAPGFAVHTVFLGQPGLITRTAAVQPNQSFMFASQALYQNDGAGNVLTHVANIIGVSHNPQLRATTSGDQLNVTNITGLSVGPSYSTVAGTTVNFGTIAGLRMAQPVQGLFQPGAGVEAMDAMHGIIFPNVTFGGAANIVNVVRSSLTSGTNRRFLNNLSTAASEFGTSVAHFNDSGVIQFGGALNAADVSLFWDGSVYRIFFFATSDSLRWTSPAADTFLFDNDGGNTTGEYRFNVHQFAFGQSTDVGNQIGIFAAPAHTVTVPGDFDQYLLSQAGSLSMGVLAMGQVSAWTINAPSFTTSGWSADDINTLRVAGMNTSAPGATIGERQALQVTGRHQQRGTHQFVPITPAALSAGDNDDWAGLLTGSPSNSTREWARITGNATTSVITGIDATAVQDGDEFTLTNVGSDTILIAHEDAGSAAANRIITPDGNSYVLSERRTAQLRYDDTTSRWRVISPPAAVAPLTGTWQFDSNTTMADPGSGLFRNNNATIGSVTAIAISDITETGVDAGNILAAVASGDQLYLQNREDADEFLVFDVTSNTDNTGWHQIGGTVNASGSNFTAGKEFLITFIFA